ncbi:DUF305 domain-containing protein [Streptomyces ochraceiscleroticus]|uniref:DUF305 domain-containing protein n=1 Tax=Streptomyces ochraceiscleroticus TaxID=47761 RepID=A0ABW1MTY0_9ACTN|nr:DUF305 domain-containing protein [Streptomyces ochraceiscleroticus]
MTAHRAFIRRTALVAATGAAALVLAACGGNDKGHDMGSMESSSKASASASPSAKGGKHNSADVSFAKEMIQHHRQAIEMADLADGKRVSSEVKDLSTEVKGAQDPEIKKMSGWLTSWGEEAPEDMSGMDHGDMDHGDMGHDMSSSMPGMMSSEDMDKLKKSSGADFDKMFLEMMVEHHKGALQMAETEKAKGEYGPAKKLADDVITAQKAEIEKMDTMLKKS